MDLSEGSEDNEDRKKNKLTEVSVLSLISSPNPEDQFPDFILYLG